MPGVSRPHKSIRLSYVQQGQDGPYLQLLGGPAEVKLGTSGKTFISVRDEGISLSPGLGNNVNIQGLPQNLRYGGMLMDLPFPLSIIPNTPFSPFPRQVFSPPLAKIVGFLSDLSLITSSLVV